MKKIAILTCLKANQVCTGAACFKAFNEKEHFFDQYREEEVELVAFFKCNGCGHRLRDDPGLQEKVERLLNLNVHVVHLGVCVQKKSGEECDIITEIVENLQNHGIKIYRGTH